jgi:hypothetical protein
LRRAFKKQPPVPDAEKDTEHAWPSTTQTLLERPLSSPLWLKAVKKKRKGVPARR